MLIALVALRYFTCQGTSYRAGQRFECSPLTAAILTHKRDARFATKDDLHKPKRTYRRRDMVASVPDQDD